MYISVRIPWDIPGHFRKADVGLPRTARRKTAGLRREEVAQLDRDNFSLYTAFVKQETVLHLTPYTRITPVFPNPIASFPP